MSEKVEVGLLAQWLSYKPIQQLDGHEFQYRRHEDGSPIYDDDPAPVAG